MSDNPQDDLEKTSKMDEPPAKKPAKEKGEWITMPMQAAKKDSPVAAPSEPAPKAAPPASAPPAAPPTAQAPVPATTPATSASMPSSGGGVGSFLSNFGINDPNTQKIVLFGGGGLILLCCACGCIAIVFSMMGNSFGQ